MRLRLRVLDGLQAKNLKGLCLGWCMDLGMGMKLDLWTCSG